MRRKIWLALPLALAIILAGWYMARVLDEDRVSKVTVAPFEAFGTVNTVPILTVKNAEQVAIIARAVKTAERLPGIICVISPDYNLSLHWTNSQVESFHLWVRQDAPAMIMNVTNSPYRVSLECRSIQATLGAGGGEIGEKEQREI